MTKVALVTGASRGIGREIVNQLIDSKQFVKVYGTYRTEFNQVNDQCSMIKLDITQNDSIESCERSRVVFSNKKAIIKLKVF